MLKTVIKVRYKGRCEYELKVVHTVSEPFLFLLTVCVLERRAATREARLLLLIRRGVNVKAEIVERSEGQWLQADRACTTISVIAVCCNVVLS
jgi:hypothetical protein